MNKTKTILIVDDDQNLVSPLKDGLEALGYRVAVAFDGLQGILQAHQSRPDAILLDLNMPGGGGDLVYERLRGITVTASTPIIFSTGAEIDEVKGRIRPSAHTYFLKKPVGLTHMASIIGDVLGVPKRDAVSATAPFEAVAPPPAVRAAAPRAAALAARPRKTRSARVHDLTLRVPYADTDPLGIVYYANFFKYFELGRVELMRSLGVRYRDIEAGRGLFLPAVETACRYLSPARYDELILVRTWVSELGLASLRFESSVLSAEGDARGIARGFSRHALVNGQWKTVRVPADLKILLEPFVGQAS